MRRHNARVLCRHGFLQGGLSDDKRAEKRRKSSTDQEVSTTRQIRQIAHIPLPRALTSRYPRRRLPSASRLDANIAVSQQERNGAKVFSGLTSGLGRLVG